MDRRNLCSRPTPKINAAKVKLYWDWLKEGAPELLVMCHAANGLDGGAQVRDAPDQPRVEREEFFQRGIDAVCGRGHLLAFHLSLSPMIAITEPPKKGHPQGA